MANGDIVGSRFDRQRQMFKLLDAQTATHTGVWVEVPDGYVFRSFESTDLEEGAADATIDIMVSNDVTKPADSTDGPITQTFDNVGPTLAVAKTESYRFVKAKKTAGTTPVATTVIMVAQRAL